MSIPRFFFFTRCGNYLFLGIFLGKVKNFKKNLWDQVSSHSNICFSHRNSLVTIVKGYLLTLKPSMPFLSFRRSFRKSPTRLKTGMQALKNHTVTLTCCPSKCLTTSPSEDSVRILKFNQCALRNSVDYLSN